MTTNSTNDTNGDEYFSPEENREAFLDFATAEILKMKSNENYQSPYSNEAWEAIIEAEPMLLDFHKEGEIGNILEKLWLEVAAKESPNITVNPKPKPEKKEHEPTSMGAHAIVWRNGLRSKLRRDGKFPQYRFNRYEREEQLCRAEGTREPCFCS
jgi:hypothetical protein